MVLTYFVERPHGDLHSFSRQGGPLHWAAAGSIAGARGGFQREKYEEAVDLAASGDEMGLSRFGRTSFTLC